MKTKKTLAMIVVMSMLLSIGCFAQTASYNGGTVSYTLNRVGSGKSSGVATTGYDVAGYIQYVVVFGYDKTGAAVISDSASSAASASAATKTKSGIKKYKSTHIIKDATGTPLKKYNLEV